MSWDEQRKLEYLLGLPWTIYTEATAEGERLVRVRELPSVIGSGEGDEEIEREFWESLEATLRSYLHFGDELPLPLDMTLPWKQGAPAPAKPQRRAFQAKKNRPRIDQPETATIERWEELKEMAET
jgi:predicted RNase H-like HicB family nuclease